MLEKDAGAQIKKELLIMGKTTHQVLESAGFKKLVRDRWTVAFILTALQFLLYYGYIVIIATNKGFLAQKIGEVTTLGIPVGVLVIVVSWLFTFVYVIWANSKYDPAIKEMNEQLKEGIKK